MKIYCPNSQCPFHLKTKSVIKDGRFKRSGDSRTIQRYRCKICKKRFSKASFTLEKYQKKRRINSSLAKNLCSSVSLRRSALLLGVNVKTVERRLGYLAQKACKKNQNFLKKTYKEKVKYMHFDDLITKENSKLKPLSVSIAVDARKRLILGAKVSQIPAFGHLAKISRERYGARACHHKKGLKALFEELRPVVDKFARIHSDEHSKYPEFVARYFPRASYERFRSERACVAGQGELKKVRFDPLFAINHTCAMFRANINRLVRKTWCTTKSVQRLQDHIDIFIWFYNRTLLKGGCPTPFKGGS